MAVSSRKGKPVRFSKSEGKTVHTKNGKTIKLLNPDQKGRRYARELKEGVNIYTGEKLTKTQKAWRAGQLQARKDSAKCYKARRKNK